MIAFENVSAGYEDTVILSGLSFSLPAHGCIALMGASGVGKTTVLRLLAGLMHPTTGRISGLAGVRAVMMFQEDRLLPWRTALCNVALSASPGADCERVLREVGIDNPRQYPNQMSGGMRRRVALARALCKDSDLLLLDEPFTGLDRALRDNVMQVVRRSRVLIVFATHDPEEVSGMGASEIQLSSTGIIAPNGKNSHETPCEKCN